MKLFEGIDINDPDTGWQVLRTIGEQIQVINGDGTNASPVKQIRVLNAGEGEIKVTFDGGGANITTNQRVGAATRSVKNNLTIELETGDFAFVMFGPVA